MAGENNSVKREYWSNSITYNIQPFLCGLLWPSLIIQNFDLQASNNFKCYKPIRAAKI